MLLSFDQAGEALDEMAEELPQVFFRDLNGGVLLLPEAMPDPDFPDDELYIMGEYCNDQMGRYIKLYYGSFAALAEAEDWTEDDWDGELYTTLIHEFTHHMEGLAGGHALDDKDAQFMADFLADQAGEEE
ncbi:MAG TPA: metallopeptidase family protein [Pseudoflavonifractor sp.]|nr:metallopeptidase family protein [Pseudoflavonifractor sp.]